MPTALLARLPHLAGTLAVAVLAAYLMLTPLAPFARDVEANDIRRHIILGGTIAAYTLVLVLSRRLPPRTVLDIPVLLVLLAIAAGIAGSRDPRTSAEWAMVVLPVMPLAYLLADRRLLTVDQLRQGVMLAAVVAAGFALASVWRQWQEWLTFVRAVEGSISRGMLFPPTVPRVSGVGSHPNVLAGVLAVSSPFFLLTLTAPRSGRWARVAAAAGLTVVLLALFFTLSRAAWVGTAAGLLVTAFGLGLTRGLRPRYPQRWLLGGLVVVALVLVLSLALGRARPGWLFRDSLNPRADMRRVGIEIFRDNPLTGAGPGMYVALYPRHNGSFPFAAVHSHNVPVQVAADYGLVGLGAGGNLLLVLGGVLVRRLLRGTDEERQAATLAAGSLAAFLVHGLADAPHLFPEVVLVLAIAPNAPASLPYGKLSVRHGLRRRTFGALGRAPALVVLMVGLALIPLWWWADWAEGSHRASVMAAREGRWDDAVAAARRAATRDPHLAVYHFQLGAALLARYHERWDPGDRADAIAAYERGLSLQPDNGAALVDLAVLRLDAGDTAGARAAVEALAPLTGRDTLLQLAYAVLVQQAFTPDRAIETYAGLLALNPTLAVTPFFLSSEFRATHYFAIVDRALARAEEITGPGPSAEGLRTAIRLLTGRDAPRAEQLRAALAVAPGDVSLQVALGRLLTAEGRRDEAGPLLQDAVSRVGDSSDARAALGDWYAAGGEWAQARREWLKAAYLGDVRAMDALGESYPAGTVPVALIRRQRELVEGAFITRFYTLFQTSRFTFLRREPVPIISRGDWLLALPNEFDRWQAHLERWEAERVEGACCR